MEPGAPSEKPWIYFYVISRRSPYTIPYRAARSAAFFWPPKLLLRPGFRRAIGEPLPPSLVGLLRNGDRAAKPHTRQFEIPAGASPESLQ
jgi:hypothetical protein